MSERAYLREVQYRDDTNLNARAALHKRFSVNPVGLQRWILDLLDLPAQAGVLEVGCGPGDLWVANLDRIPPGWRVVLSDFSPGMVEAARRRLGSHRFDSEAADFMHVSQPVGDRVQDTVGFQHLGKPGDRAAPI